MARQWTDERKAKLAAAAKARWDALPDAEKERRKNVARESSIRRWNALPEDERQARQASAELRWLSYPEHERAERMPFYASLRAQVTA